MDRPTAEELLAESQSLRKQSLELQEDAEVARATAAKLLAESAEIQARIKIILDWMTKP